MTEVLLSIGQEVIIDIVKNIYSDKTLAHGLERDLKKVS